MTTEPGPAGEDTSAAEVLRFWFQELNPSQWFRRSDGLDRTVSQRFGPLTDLALAGGLDPWGTAPDTGLALVLLLDQFPRQIWRGQARSFAGDPAALALALGALERGWTRAEGDPDRRRFWLMPLMHSEDLAVQERSCGLFEELTDPDTSRFAERHRDVIRRFGRFPHRNRALGRPGSIEEEAFLREPGSHF